MAIVDVRIDDRLIHGQVCSYWIPYHSVDRIVIVDDGIAHDEMRKTALRFGCPGECKLSIFTAEKAATKLAARLDRGINVMVLCATPQPLVDMADEGFAVQQVTVGNMSTKPCARQIRKTVFVSPQEVRAFSELASRGIRIYDQMIPNAQREDITALFQPGGEGLKFEQDEMRNKGVNDG
ncbi:PTS sugar transporter subunit IIB [Collinsella sp. AGMB00827]|uniref:PTS sugar transporter subunit IIB n=1 Tax=Collinsella ureilytica TaxID=2869515 RepID=A0ABS7MIV3_9ACTN|nr:PTS sugar transporter subunit IIB [Collinsella urealyticum]MBY4797020.1 PTS sugar transporter subunit IIB [Collinsella urealyticum]